MNKITVGDKVNKPKGYKFPGTVVAAFDTLAGERRYVVELDGYGLLHIFNGEQLEPRIDCECTDHLRVDHAGPCRHSAVLH